MKELTAIRDAVLSAFKEAGITALAAFPAERARDYNGAVAVVAVDTAESKTVGFCNYLGEAWDEEAGTIKEFYGKRLDAAISVEIRGPQAAACNQGAEAAAEVLLGGLPSGIRPGELSWEGICWEKETGMLLRRGRLQCQAVFVAKSSDADPMFLDFILKGVLTT